jgi:hypothetical protein
MLYYLVPRRNVPLVYPRSRVFAGRSLYNQLRVTPIVCLVAFMVIGGLKKLIVICTLISISLAYSQLVLNYKRKRPFNINPIYKIKRL